MHNYFCDHCGAALDPGEICDCKQQPEESERRIVTYADWEAAGDFSKAAQPGDYVEERIVDDMRDVLPPAKMERGFLQVGEPYSHEFDLETGHWRGTFPTFVKEGQKTTSSDMRRATRGPTSCSATARAAPSERRPASGQ